MKKIAVIAVLSLIAIFAINSVYANASVKNSVEKSGIYASDSTPDKCPKCDKDKCDGKCDAKAVTKDAKTGDSSKKSTDCNTKAPECNKTVTKSCCDKKAVKSDKDSKDDKK